MTHQDDLQLASAAAAGDPAAQRRVTEKVGAILRRQRGAALIARSDEAQQRVLMHLFGVGDDDARLTQYSGKGALDSWLRVVVTRLALNNLRDDAALHRGEVPLEDDAPWPVSEQNPELMLLKMQHKQRFKQAFAKTTDQLTPRERLLLKLRFCDGMQQDDIAKLLSAHRVTVANWLKDAHDKLRRLLISELRAQTPIAQEDATSLDAWMQSQPDLSLSRLFAKSTSLE